MDVTFNNVLEGTRQYFMGLPKQAPAEGSGQPAWQEGAPPSDDSAPTQSSRPPSAPPPAAPPPRPPSEPFEPEPHIIDKATVMREAAEKRREQPEPDDEEEAADALSPPSHIICRPQPSPAPAPAAPCPSPARPPSAAPPAPAVARPPDHYPPARPPDPYTASRPPESYQRYHYDASPADNGRNSRGPPNASPQPSVGARHSPQQTYARMSSSMPQHASSRLREASSVSHSPPAQRYVMPPQQPSQQQPPPHNDRVPPIHHPQAPRVPPMETRPGAYPVSQRRETSPYARPPSTYDRYTHTMPTRKYDHQQAYPGYRPPPTAPQPPHMQNHRVEQPHSVPYKTAPVDSMGAHYGARPVERVPAPPPPHQHDVARLPPRAEYPSMSRAADSRSNYPYPTPSTSTVRYAPSAPVPVVQNSSRTPYRPAATAPKSNYNYSNSTQVQTSPARSTVKPGYPNQARMTVSVTSLVNEMNQTKQKRESPLDLSVKTVKNSADSSTTQDDVVDSATSVENKTLSLHPRPSSSSRPVPPHGPGYASLKVDFAPDFTQCRERERTASHSYSPAAPSGHPAAPRYNGTYETPRPVGEPYPAESRPQYVERSKYGLPVARADYVPRIDLTRSVNDDRHPENRIRDDRNFLIEERKRPSGPIVSNISEKIVRYETWSSDSRIDRMSRSAREQHDLMNRPVYSYSSHKQYEAYKNEQKRSIPPAVYRDHHHHSHSNHRYPYPVEVPRDQSDYHARHYYERNPSSNSRHVIQKIPSHRDVPPHHLIDPHSSMPANKRVLSILRNSLETRHAEPPRPAKQIPDLIVIDDDVIEITDLTKEESAASSNSVSAAIPNRQPLNHHIQMPKAVDSLPKDSEYQRLDNSDPKSKSPENDVAARIRTKAELKVMPPSQDNSTRTEMKQDVPDNEVKIKPKSQKQHLFNQIREDNLRLESVIKSEKPAEIILPEVKAEPMNIEEIEKDAEVPIKTEMILEELEPDRMLALSDAPADDLDWASACDNFMEQLKTGCHKKKSLRRKRMDTESESEPKSENSVREDMTEPLTAKEDDNRDSSTNIEDSIILPTIVVKQEPIDEDYATEASEPPTTSNHETPSNEQNVPNEEETLNEMDFVTNNTEKEKVTPVNKVSDKSSNKEDKIKTNKLDQKSDKSKLEKRKYDKSKSLTSKSEKGDKIKKGNKSEKSKEKRSEKEVEKIKGKLKTKIKTEKIDKETLSNSTSGKKDPKDKESVKTIIKEELESTDDDEPLINSKIQKEKEQNEKFKNQILKDLSEKSVYVKLECCDMDVNKNTRRSVDSSLKDKEEKQAKVSKATRQSLRSKGKSLSIENNTSDKNKVDSTSDSDDEDVSVASRLRVRKSVKEKTEDVKTTATAKTPVKSSPKKQDNSSSNSTPVRKPGFGDGSDFHPGWEEELYRYKRSLRMPTRLIAIPRGRSGGPFIRGPGAHLTRGTTSLPDLDPAPLSPAPSSAPSAATDDLYARRQDKHILDSDLDSNSSCSAANRLHYDSEASTSTIFSSNNVKKKGSSSIVDVLIQKYGRGDLKKRAKDKDKDDKTPKVIPKSSNTTELLATPSLGLVKNGNKGNLSAKREKLMEDIFYLGAFRKETVTAFRNAFIKDTDGLIGATEEFQPIVLKSRTRTESRVLKQRATIKEVFGDERPASAPPTSCRDDDLPDSEEEMPVVVKKEPESKPKLKPKKIIKDKMKRRSSSIRDGLRSTKSLKRNDAKGRLLRLKKRNNLVMSLANKRLKDINKIKKDKSPTPDEKDKSKDEGSSLTNGEGNTKRRLKRLFGRRKFSSGFDYIRKKKKIIRRDEATNRVRRPAAKPSPESVHDIQKEIKGWFINKSVGETHLHRAARLGYTDCVAYCLEKMEADPSAKDNAGFTPLHVASANGYVRIARLLLQYGANVSAAAQGGIRPLHEACENCHVEVIRLLLAYGADPLLGTYSGQTPQQLAEGPAARLLRLHVADVQGLAVEPWKFPPLTDAVDREELGCDPLSSPPPASPPPPADVTLEIQCTEAPLPPFYSLRAHNGQPADGLWCLLQDITNLLQIKSKESLLKQIHCGSGSPKELLREIRTQEFLERAQCHQLLCAGEKVNVRASKVALVRVTDKLRQLLKIETVLVS